MPVNRKGSALCVFVMALVSVSVRWWGLRRLKPLLGVTTRTESTKQPPAVIEEEPHEIARGNDELRIKHDGRYSRRVGDSNRCSDLDMRLFDRGRACGPPMSSPCVDLSRCHGGDTAALPAVRDSHDSGMGGVKIYVFDSGCSLSDSGDLLFDGAEQDPHFIDWVFRKAAREAGVLAPTYDSACLFVHVTRGEKEPCAVSTPLWNSGVNHVMVDFGDQGREGRPTVADSYAMDAASNMHSCAYRSGFDVSLPLAPERRFHTLAGIAPLDRRFFLTTKGTVYLSGHGSEERFSIAPLQDEANGVIVSMHCFENHGEHLLPENTEYCQQLKETYSDHDFASLLNTTFGLVPAGRSPGTYRLAEVMGAGAIPVIVARDVVPPFSEQHDWAAFSFTFAPDQVGPDMMATLRAIPQAQLEEMQRKSLEVYRKIFGTDDTLLGPSAFGPIADGLFNILMRRIEHRGAG